MAKQHTMRLRFLVCLGLFGWPLFGCARPAPAYVGFSSTIAGAWRSARGPRVFEVRLRLSGAEVSGYGVLRDPLGQNSVWTVRGQYTPPTFILQFVNHDRILARYVGRLAHANDTMRGVLYDSGPPTDSLIFFRLLTEN